MRDDEDVIDFSKLSAELFEELCYEIVERSGFYSLRWRRGGADRGRDIEALLDIDNPLVRYQERWFFECKNHASGIPVTDVDDKFSWAQAEGAHHLVLMLSSYPTTACSEWIEKRATQVSFRVHVIEGKRLKQLVQVHRDLVERYFATRVQRLIVNAKLDWRLAGVVPGAAHLARLTKDPVLDALDPAALSLLLVGAAGLPESPSVGEEVTAERLLALARAAELRVAEAPVTVAQPEAGGESVLDPFLAGPTQGEARTTTTRLSPAVVYQSTMRTVSLATAHEPLEGFHCWLRTGEEIGVEAVVLRAASQAFAVYGLRVARAEQAANTFPLAGLDRDITDVRIRGTISSRVTFHVEAEASNDE
jgi:Restriction endonuclease